MTDWKQHDGGPQPVADDVWVYVSGSFNSNYPSEASDADWPNVKHFLVLNQHLINAARLEGIRLGLEAAAREAVNWAVMPANFDDAIRLLDPATIAKEASREP
jgi:hypothetical protein